MINILEKIKLDKKKAVVILVAALVLVYLDYNFILSAQLKKTGAIKAQIVKLKTDIDKLHKDLASLAGEQRKQQEAGKTATKVKRLISNGQIPLLLKEISDLANTHQVRIMQIKPEKEIKDTKAAKSAKAQNITGERIYLDLSCDFHHLGQFLNALENSEIFLELGEMKINSLPNDYFRQNVRLELKTYVRD